MRNSRWSWIGVYVVATALLAGGVIFLIQDRDDTSEAASTELTDLAPMPFASGLTPVGATTGRVGDRLTFQATGYTADDVRSVELWDGGTRIETDPAPGGPSALLTLPALSVGSHAVYAKVVDGKGQTSITAPVPVDVVANGSEPVAPVEVVPDEDETVEALAKRLDVDVDRIAVLAAGTAALDPKDVRPLELAPTDVIPVDAIVTAQPDGDAGLDDAISPDPVVAAGGGTSSGGGGLALAAKADGCAVTLTVSGASGTVDLWDGAGSSAGWRRVGQRNGNGTLTVPAVTPGVHLYFASMPKGETSPVQVTMPSGCTKAVGWTGEASIADGILTVTNGMGTGNQWLYLQVDGGTAVRVPATGSLPPVGLHTDIGSLLPPLEGKSLDLELWQGDEFIDELAASGHLDAPDGGSISDVVGESRQLDLKLTDPAGSAAVLDTQDRKLTFTWTAGPRIEAVLYQVLVDDLPIAQTTAIPEQLLLTGVGARSDAGATGSGTFTIDTAAIPGRTATGRDATGSVTAAYPVAMPQLTGAKITSSKPATVSPIGPKTAAQAAEAPILIDLPTYGDSVYVRAIGLSSGGSGAISASNSIRVQLPTPQGVDGKTVDFVSGTDFGDTTFDPGHLPVRAFGPCVWADVSWTGPIDYGPYQERTPNGPTVRIETMSKAYPADGTYCPADFAPPPPPAGVDCPVAQFFCDVWEGIEEFGGAILTAAEAVYSFATAVMTTVVDKVAGAVATYSGVCDALDGVAKGSKKSCGAVLTMATKAAISAVLVSVGVPPVLPDPGILAAVAKGDFASVAVTLMEATGIPCSSFKPDPDVAEAMDTAASKTTGTSGLVAAVKDPCLAIATALVATVKANVLTRAQAALAQGAGLPYVPIISAKESLTLTPSPLGRTGPTRVTLRMQPRDDNADARGITCSVTVRVVNVATDGGTERTVIPSQVVAVPELPAPNRGRWEKTVVLGSDAPLKNLVQGTWHLRATTPMAPGGCLLTSIDLEGTPPTLPNYAKDRKKGQPTVPAARPNG